MSESSRVAFVISNQATSSVAGWPIGFWLAELTHPYFEFTSAGFQAELFSPDGGELYVVDGNLITGQQQHSGAETARLAIGLLTLGAP